MIRVITFIDKHILRHRCLWLCIWLAERSDETIRLPEDRVDALLARILES